MRIGLVGIDGSHAELFLRHFNSEARFDDMRVTSIWGRNAPNERVAELLALSPSIEAVPDLTSLIAAVDAVIVGDRHGDLHARHALPCIAAGKPVFIDKPLACAVTDATAILDAAERAATPLLSASALRWQADTLALKSRIKSADTLSLRAFGTWYPNSEYGGAIFYAIHTIELALELLGPAWTNLRRADTNHTAIAYDTARGPVQLTFHPLSASGSSAFGASATTGAETVDQSIALPDDYMLPVVERIVRMLRTGQSGLTRDELLAPIRMMAEIDRVLAAT